MLAIIKHWKENRLDLSTYNKDNLSEEASKKVVMDGQEGREKLDGLESACSVRQWLCNNKRLKIDLKKKTETSKIN